MELESVGNIRLEEGCSADPWYSLVFCIIHCNYSVIHSYRWEIYPPFFFALTNRFKSCCDLLLSRFSPPDYRMYGITDIKVDRVIRIHNSALRLRFEDKLHSLLASDDLSSQ